MKTILFVCHGNICRSPMAEFVMKEEVRRAGRSADFEISSAAVSREEEGRPVYPPVRALLEAEGIDVSGKRARRVCIEDYRRCDEIYVMDFSNLRRILALLGGDPQGKIRLLRSLEYSEEEQRTLSERQSAQLEIEDPWYSGNYERVRDLIKRCIRKRLEREEI